MIAPPASGAPARLTSLLALTTGALVLASLLPSPPAEGSATGAALSARHQTAPVLVPLVLEACRNPITIEARLLIANALPPGQTIQISAMRVMSGGFQLLDRSMGHTLAADPRYVEVNALIERLPLELSELHRPRAFAPADAPTFEGDEILERWNEINDRIATLQSDYETGTAEPFVEVPFLLPLDQVFASTDTPGTVHSLRFEVDYLDPRGVIRQAVAEHSIRLLPRSLPVPDTFLTSTASTSSSLAGRGFDLSQATIHAGDLHVHTCHGEALGACTPSSNCGAETVQISGSIPLSQLKTEFQALGCDWYTATDHSYCINDDAEFTAIAGEAAAITDASFLCLPHTELSSEEEGNQIGSDLADLLCLFGTSASHMGAHGITSRKYGGEQGLLGFCNGLFNTVLLPFTQNIAAIRAEGGFPIANHPSAATFGFNSFDDALGIEANALHGVEIWNGGTNSGQGGSVQSWTDWLDGGRILYAYSGSDTHDSAYAFGMNNAVFLGESFDGENLMSIVRNGRLFLSNGQVLILEVELDGQSLLMGTIESYGPAQAASTMKVRSHYNFGIDTATITVFKGTVGSGEVALVQSAPLSGQGVYEITDTLDTTGRTWYRAYSENTAITTTAYTNPVFFLPGSCAYQAYGVGLGGANVATLSSNSTPTIGSVNRLDVSGFDASSPSAIFLVSPTQFPNGIPFQGGLLLIGTPLPVFPTAALTAGSGFATFQLPLDRTLIGASFHWQAGALDLTQAGGVALTNGLTLTACDLLQ